MQLYNLNKGFVLNQVQCIEEGFSVEEIDKLNSQLALLNPYAATVGPPATSLEEYEKSVIDSHKIRKSNICFIDTDSVEFSWVYEKLSYYINYVNTNNYRKFLYGIEPLQYGEYDSKYNGFYGVHVDSRTSDIHSMTNRSLSFSVQLCSEDEYGGGELLIHDGIGVMKASKKKGSITFFDSLIQHEVTPVTSGFRKSLVGWVHGPRV